MKNPVFFLLFLLYSVIPEQVVAQAGDTSLLGKVVVIEINDGGTQVGTLLSDDGHEVLIATTDKGKMYIPKYVITSIQPVSEKNFHNKGYIRPHEFPHYYILSPSARILPREKICMRFTYFSAAVLDIGINDRSTFSFGSLGFVGYGAGYTYRGKSKEHSNFGFNITTGGILSQIGGRHNHFSDQTGMMGRVFLTLGNDEHNVTFSAGGGTLFNFDDAGVLFGVAGMQRINKRILLLAEGIAVPNYEVGLAIISMRLITRKANAWDVGLLSPMYQDHYYYRTTSGQHVQASSFTAFVLPYFGYHLKF